MKLGVGGRFLIRDSDGCLAEVEVLGVVPELGLVKIQWDDVNGGVREWLEVSKLDWTIEHEFPKVEAICENCRFWFHKSRRTAFGECRFNPPDVEYGYPETHIVAWCGKHEPKGPEPVEVEI